jgi:hypothetical protein
VRGGTTVGGLVGGNKGTINNSYAAVNVTGSHFIGGLVGYNNGYDEAKGTITNSYATGNVNGYLVVGGLAAEHFGIIENSYFTGNVSGKYSVGGLVGYGYNTFYDAIGTITNCYALGSVSGTVIVGGLAGVSVGTITSCYFSGDITETENSFGRLVGINGYNDIEEIYRDIFNSIQDEYFDAFHEEFIGYIIENFFEGAICSNSALKTESELRQQSTFVNWDFNNIWVSAPNINNGFPHLLSLKEPPATYIFHNFTTNRTTNTATFAGIRNGQINLNLKAGNYTAELYNLQGRIISKTNINATNGINTIGLRTDNLAKGMFVLNVKQAGTSVLRQKISVR